MAEAVQAFLRLCELNAMGVSAPIRRSPSMPRSSKDRNVEWLVATERKNKMINDQDIVSIIIATLR